ncbi:putative dehydrogenase [Sphingobium sp. B2D3A]|uniref:Gfo/Idh/MocA family protein n=1 Tax=unclassified Sphingobium TaxID=2611147 RepID=UPI0029CAAE19|nr:MULTISPECIES: Gfo/Idh/MocA family oxidoreductase [unclassified Sphingobium]MCW2337861.1 putative dehydrogenase [Sphingobium sp. B2D3A]MCW2384319.1 putative dehydrogenase [Sphingobium sp. B2D3D]
MLNMAMIGGGGLLSIGQTHRIAAEATGQIRLVAGVFSSDPARSRQAGLAYGIDPARAYADVSALLAGERDRVDGADFATIVTPNHLHYPAAVAALEAGLAVMSDKPMTARLDEARRLAALVKETGRPFAVSYPYGGFAAVRAARAMIAEGELGAIRKVSATYAQGWLASAARDAQAAWRVDPARSGVGGCIADIGVHAFHLAEFVSGLHVSRIMADLGSVVPGRTLDDDCAVLLRFENDARGTIMASQIEAGEGNRLRLRCDGEAASLVWTLDDPHALTLHPIDGASLRLAFGEDEPEIACPPGVRHAEGYMAAFATLYRDFAAVLHGNAAPSLPGVQEGLRGVAFIETAVAASRAQNAWVDLAL